MVPPGDGSNVVPLAKVTGSLVVGDVHLNASLQNGNLGVRWNFHSVLFFFVFVLDVTLLISSTVGDPITLRAAQLHHGD
jgi:hypothetical protein